MKRILTILLLAFTSCVCLHAQGHYVRYIKQNEGTTTIIRSYLNYPYTEVCYSREANTNYIEVRKGGTIINRITVPKGYSVKDMKIFDNILYLCGACGNKGFVGVVNLQEIYLNTPQGGNPYGYAAVSFLDLDETQVSSLEKLVVYSSGGSPSIFTTANEHVVAIGKSGSQITPNWVTVHLKFNNIILDNSISWGSGSVNIEILSDNTSPSNEELQDVVLTDNYVAIIRFRYATGEYIIHRCYRNNIAGTYNTIYRYPCPNYEALSYVRGVGMENDHIAVASLATVQNSTSSFEIRIRNIDLPTMSVVTSQALPLWDQKHDIELAYNEDQRKIMMMMYYRPVGWTHDTHSFFEIDPWCTSTYPSDANIDIDGKHYTSHYHSNGNYFVATSSNTWFRKTIPLLMGSNCFSGLYLIVTPIDPVVFTASIIETTVGVRIDTPPVETYRIWSTNNMIDCETIINNQ